MASSHPSLPAKPLPASSSTIPFHPSAAPSPSTIYLLPALLSPLTPQASALHVARIRLLNHANDAGSSSELPGVGTRADQIKSVPKDGTWCCTKCGHLRSGWGWKVVKVKRVLGVEDAGLGAGAGKGKKSGRTSGGKGKKRKREGDEENDGSGRGGDGVRVKEGLDCGTSTTSASPGGELSLHGPSTIEAVSSTSPDPIRSPSPSPITSPPRHRATFPPTPPPRTPKNKLKTKCSLCGLDYAARGSEPSSIGRFRNARVVAREGAVGEVEEVWQVEGGGERRSTRASSRSRGREKAELVENVFVDGSAAGSGSGVGSGSGSTSASGTLPGGMLMDGMDNDGVAPVVTTFADTTPPTGSEATIAPSTSPLEPQPPSIILRSPSLAHIQTSHPTVQTESPPPAQPPLLSPPATSASGSLGSLGGGVDVNAGSSASASKKRKKKSGLGKLLAESESRRKEKEDEDRSRKGLGFGLGMGLGGR